VNLLLIRHGEILSNVKRVYAGRSEEALTKKGICQAYKVAERIKKDYNIHALYTSPIKRALQTAEIIGKIIGREVIVEEAFKEMEMEPWEGMSEEEIASIYPEEWQIWLTRPAELSLPGRERLDELLVRVKRSIQEICRNRKDQNIVVVTHVAIIRVLWLWYTHKSLNLYKTIHVPNAKIFKLKIRSCQELK